MYNRENTPDILGSIMTGGATVKKEEYKAPVAVVAQQEELKEKATFNLPVALLSELEDKYYELRKLCKSKQVSKTLIVEESLRIVLGEFASKKQESKLFVRLLENKAIKK